jgi:parvulin-like peptidyl-prolyl isomerase
MRFVSRRVASIVGAVGLLVIGFMFGQMRSEPLAAQPPGKAVVGASGTASAPAPAADRRVIAYVYGNTAITREEFGDYLIEQFGKDRVRLYVNRRIIEMAAAKRNIVVTPQEIEVIIDQDCGRLGMNKEQFLARVVKEKYGQTVREWREDVIKPRLMLQAMCKDTIKIDEADLKKVYENLYGEKVQCKIILWPQEQKKDVLRLYDKLRSDPKAFDDAARTQLSSDLAVRGGMVDPIGRYSGPGTAKIEEIAFQLKDGQLSEMIDTGGGILLIKRIQSIPPKKDVTFESVRGALVKELTERLVEQEIPKTFAKLNEEAKPLFIMSPANETREETLERSKRLGVDPGPLEKN